MLIGTRRALLKRKGQNAARPWYLSGGVAAANCVAAYQPKGAASFAASLLDLTGNGNHAIDPGGAATPAWDAVNGWKGASGDYLTTALTPASDRSWTMIVCFSNAVAGAYVCGSMKSVDGSLALAVRPDNASAKVAYYHGAYSKPLSVAPAMAAGILALAGPTCYRNGVAETGAPDAGTGDALPVNALGLNLNGTPYGYVVYVQAQAWYNTALTGPQVAAVTAAMAAI